MTDRDLLEAAARAAGMHAVSAPEKEVVYFARFLAPGSFVAESWTQLTESADPKRIVWPESAYAASMHKRVDVVDGGVRYEGPVEQIGPLYYHPNSFVQSLDEARANPKATPILISNMECNGWAQIIWTRWGNWPQPFDPSRMAIVRAAASMAPATGEEHG